MRGAEQGNSMKRKRSTCLGVFPGIPFERHSETGNLNLVGGVLWRPRRREQDV